MSNQFTYDTSKARDRIAYIEAKLSEIKDYDTQSAKQKAANIDAKVELTKALTFQKRAVELRDRMDSLECAGFTHEEAFAIIMALIKENKGIN